MGMRSLTEDGGAFLNLLCLDRVIEGDLVLALRLVGGGDVVLGVGCGAEGVEVTVSPAFSLLSSWMSRTANRLNLL